MRVTRRAGLTLVEVVISVTLLAAGVAVVAEALTAAIRASSHSEDRLAAAAVADALRARLETGEILAADASGDVATDFPDCLPWWTEAAADLPSAPLSAEEQASAAALHHTGRWGYEITVTNTDHENLVEIALTVGWQRRGTDHTLRVVRLWNQWPEVGQ